MNFQWKWSEIGSQTKKGRVYNFPLTFGSKTMEQRSEELVSLESSLEDMVEDGNITRDTRDIVMAISRAAKIVSAITRWEEA